VIARAHGHASGAPGEKKQKDRRAEKENGEVLPGKSNVPGVKSRD
jgi:hypothetical protein